MLHAVPSLAKLWLRHCKLDALTKQAQTPCRRNSRPDNKGFLALHVWLISTFFDMNANSITLSPLHTYNVLIRLGLFVLLLE